MELRVDPAAVQAMAARWGVSASELHQTSAPAGLGLSCQASAPALDAAHAEVAAFTTGLAARVHGHASGVNAADTSYVAQEAESAASVSALSE